MKSVDGLHVEKVETVRRRKRNAAVGRQLSTFFVIEQTIDWKIAKILKYGHCRKKNKQGKVAFQQLFNKIVDKKEGIKK